MKIRRVPMARSRQETALLPFSDVNENFRKAVIYCRVSGKKQTAEGSGLDSQEYRCRQYAAERGYSVEAVFPDDVTGEGDFMKRKGMVALLKFLDDNPHENYVVIFDDLKRYARDVEFHLVLRRQMAERGAKRECLNFPFEDTPEGRFNETINAAVGQLEREQMGRQNRQKSMARIEQGYWVFRAPVGYSYAKSQGGGKELVLSEPHASIVREALEGYAHGRFASQTEVRRFLEAQPEYPKDMPNGGIRPQTIVRLLGKVVYAGYVEAPKWGISPRQGNHPAIISYKTYQKIQTRLNTPVYASARKDISEDFPLRGGVCCASCQKPLTAGWSRGKYNKFPYYRCKNKSCDDFGKSIRKDQIEGQFEELLLSAQPSKETLTVARAMFEHCWDQMSGQAASLRADIRRRISKIDSEITSVVDYAVNAQSPSVRTAYEKKIETMERERLVLTEKLQNSGRPKYTFSQLFELSMRFLSNPCKIWRSGRLDLQKTVLRLVFSEPIHYCRDNGFLNTNFSIPFNMLGGQNMPILQNGAAGED
ncbi:MAG: recombinase family protein [Pseudomonadota bacterium]